MKTALFSIFSIVLSSQNMLAGGSHMEQLQSEFLSKTNSFYELVGNDKLKLITAKSNYLKLCMDYRLTAVKYYLDPDKICPAPDLTSIEEIF